MIFLRWVDGFDGDALPEPTFDSQDTVRAGGSLAKFTDALSAHKNRLARFKVENSRKMVVGLLSLQQPALSVRIALS
jgi:hypothetical protein